MTTPCQPSPAASAAQKYGSMAWPSLVSTQEKIIAVVLGVPAAIAANWAFAWVVSNFTLWQWFWPSADWWVFYALAAQGRTGYDPADRCGRLFAVQGVRHGMVAPFPDSHGRGRYLAAHDRS
jgi:hypothetical protein